jgi:uncharacterized protein (TIGR03067 family)
MRALLLISVLATAAPVRPHRDPVPVPDQAPRLADQLLGEWVTVQYIRGGTVDKGAADVRIRFTRTHFEINERQLGMKIEATYLLDAAKLPACIDIVVPDQPGLVVRAILKIEGGQLILCLHDGGEGERPTAFASPPGSSISLVTLKRASGK